MSFYPLGVIGFEPHLSHNCIFYEICGSPAVWQKAAANIIIFWKNQPSERNLFANVGWS